MSKKRIIILFIIGILFIVTILLIIAFKSKNNEVPEVDVSSDTEIEENINNNNQPSNETNQVETDQVETESSSEYTPGKEDIYGDQIKEQLTPELEKITKGESYPDYNKWLYDVYHTLDEYYKDANIKDITNVTKIDIYLNKSGKKLFYILSDKNDNKDIIYSKFIMRNNKPDIYTNFFVPVKSYTNNVYEEIINTCDKLGTFEDGSSVITYASNRYDKQGRFNVLSQALKENKGANTLSEKELNEFDLYCSLMDNRNYINSSIYKSKIESFETIPTDKYWFENVLRTISGDSELYKNVESVEVYNLKETKTNFIVLVLDGETQIYQMYKDSYSKKLVYEEFDTHTQTKAFVKILSKKCKKIFSKKTPSSLNIGQW